MEKRCYICGKIIEKGTFHYEIDPNSYVCDSKECFDFYFWDNLAICMVHNRWHEYVIVDRKVYQIGSNDDKPRGFGGKYWAIQFNDGYYVETNSLWLLGDLPKRLLHDFLDNAKFVTH